MSPNRCITVSILFVFLVMDMERHRKTRDDAETSANRLKGFDDNLIHPSGDTNSLSSERSISWVVEEFDHLLYH